MIKWLKMYYITWKWNRELGKLEKGPKKNAN